MKPAWHQQLALPCLPCPAVHLLVLTTETTAFTVLHQLPCRPTPPPLVTRWVGAWNAGENGAGASMSAERLGLAVDLLPILACHPMQTASLPSLQGGEAAKVRLACTGAGMACMPKAASRSTCLLILRAPHQPLLDLLILTVLPLLPLFSFLAGEGRWHHG